MEQILKFIATYVVTIIRYSIIAGIPFLIIYKLGRNKFVKNKIQERIATNKNFLNEFKHSLQSGVILTLVGFIILFTPLRAFTKIYTDINAYSKWWIPTSIFIAIILHDSYFYWMHRILHHKKLFNKAHIIHHHSTNPSPWAAYSFHLIEGFTEALILPIILFIIPMHPVALFSFTVISLMINVYGHLGYEVAPKWFRKSFLFEILNSSVYHNLHHHKFKGNYGLYFRIWDRICKTEHPDYVKRYDEIQQNRFNQSSTVTNKFFLFLPFIFFASFANAQSIEGKWKDSKTGSIVEIYKSAEKYYGKVITSGNKEEDAKIGKKIILILKNFEKKDDQSYCCGTIYLPRRKINASGKIKVLSKDKIKVSGSYLFLSHTMIWEKV
jgi:Delta7-sterol 5-desaturase